MQRGVSDKSLKIKLLSSGYQGMFNLLSGKEIQVIPLISAAIFGLLLELLNKTCVLFGSKRILVHLHPFASSHY